MTILNTRVPNRFPDIRIGDTQEEAFDPSYNQTIDARALGLDTIRLAEHKFILERMANPSCMEE